MKTKREHCNGISVHRAQEAGNALIYVLIAIVLFAALGFSLARQTRNSGTNEIDEARAQIYATDFMAYSAQVRSVVEQMIYSGTDIDDLDFTLPGKPGYSTPPHINKVYHPQGGGLSPVTLPDKAKHQISDKYPSRWYLDNFNNVGWTKTSATDVILTAHQIAKPVCEKINVIITGSKAIPALTVNLSDVLVNSSTNYDFDTSACPSCMEYSTLCVSNKDVIAYSFYTIVAER
jgi:hypothetical protein